MAEALLNPFGEDDDDFEMNFLIDKNITVSFCLIFLRMVQVSLMNNVDWTGDCG